MQYVDPSNYCSGRRQDIIQRQQFNKNNGMVYAMAEALGDKGGQFEKIKNIHYIKF